MMCAIVIGCSGAIAMSLIIRKKQVEKQRRQQVVVITVHKFSYAFPLAKIKFARKSKEVFHLMATQPKSTQVE